MGKNGAGKTSVAEAVTVALSQAAHAVSPGPEYSPPWELTDSDVRNGSSELLIRLSTGPIGVDVMHRRGGAESEATGTLVEALRHATETGTGIPLLRSLPTDRTSHNVSSASIEPRAGLEAWRHAFSVGVAVFGPLLPWFRREENLENEIRLNQDPKHRQPALEVVRRALEVFLSHVEGATLSNPRISRVLSGGSGDGLLVLDKAGTTLAIDQLSDGERLIVLLVLDLARRLAMVAVDDTDALTGRGIVVIDEIEQHLHPAWQASLLPGLHATFPGLQFVVTTHSPLVIASVPGDAVRLLHDFAAWTVPPTYGRDSNSLLETVFRAPARPKEIGERLDAIGALIDAEKLDEARVELANLAKTITDEDPEVVRLRSLLAFLSG